MNKDEAIQKAKRRLWNRGFSVKDVTGKEKARFDLSIEAVHRAVVFGVEEGDVIEKSELQNKVFDDFIITIPEGWEVDHIVVGRGGNLVHVPEVFYLKNIKDINKVLDVPYDAELIRKYFTPRPHHKFS